MIDREPCGKTRRKIKGFLLSAVKLIAEGIKLAAAIGTVAAAFMAWKTLDEMQIERNNAYRPEIVVVPNSFKGELLKEDELEIGRKYLFFDYSAESPSNFYSHDMIDFGEPKYKENCICLEWPYLTLKNIGQGTAKNIEVTFSSDWFVRAADQLSYYPEVDRGIRISRGHKFTTRIESNDKEDIVDIYYIDMDEISDEFTQNSVSEEDVEKMSHNLWSGEVPKKYITYIASGEDSVDIMIPSIYCRMLGAFYYLPLDRLKSSTLGGSVNSFDLPELVITIHYSDMQEKSYEQTISIPWTGSYKYITDLLDWVSPPTMEIETDFYEHYSR